MTDTEVAHARAIQGIGIRTSQVMDMFVLQSGGYENVSFSKKELYNKLDAARKQETVDGDAECAIAYLSAKKDCDLLFFYKYVLDDENKLVRLFWTDSQSRVDCEHFGDVLVFDTT